MKTVAEIERAIAALPMEDFLKLGQWFETQRHLRWDDRMRLDAESGKLDFLSAELDKILAEGKVRLMPRQP